MDKRNTLLRMLKTVKEEDKGIFGMCVLYTFFAIITPLLSVALPKLLIGYITDGNTEISGILLISAGYFLFAGVASFLRRLIGDYSGPRITAVRIGYIRKTAMKLISIPYKYMEMSSFFDENEKALEATSSNGNGFEGILHKLFEVPQILLVCVALSVFIGLKSVVILLALIIHIAATLAVNFAVQKNNYAHKEALTHEERHVNYYQRAAKDFSYGKDVRLYDLKSRILSNFESAIIGYKHCFASLKNKEYALGFITLFTLLLSDVATYGILTYYTLSSGNIADYSMYLAAAVSLTAQFGSLSENITFVANELMYVTDMYGFLDKSMDEKRGSTPAPSSDKPVEIEFDRVTFRYPGTDKYIYKDFSLKIPAGQRLALVGVNGAGKTTFVKLLTGLFEQESGTILINGVDSREYNLKQLFSIFAVVLQDVNVFAFTIAQNVACKLDDIDIPKVEKAIADAGLSQKIASLPKGLNTMLLKVIEEDGTMFSGGESQKLSIARALYKGGSCVIMDEPTSALDALAEAEIYEHFDTLTNGKTAIYISHRLASTKFCDVIALIDGDGLREYGTHDELMEKGGIYRDMFITQGKYYQEGACSK